jgi:hypothetical protein
MSIQNTVTRFLTVGVTLSLAGVALARQPPALSTAQLGSARAIACEGAMAHSSAGYRDMALRVDTEEAQASRNAALGYRGKVAASASTQSSQVACRPDAPRFSAQR